jgi:hypothetical protein
LGFITTYIGVCTNIPYFVNFFTAMAAKVSQGVAREIKIIPQRTLSAQRENEE